MLLVMHHVEQHRQLDGTTTSRFRHTLVSTTHIICMYVTNEFGKGIGYALAVLRSFAIP